MDYAKCIPFESHHIFLNDEFQTISIGFFLTSVSVTKLHLWEVSKVQWNNFKKSIIDRHNVIRMFYRAKLLVAIVDFKFEGNELKVVLVYANLFRILK